ncbi:PREDICTED: leucine-rich repeat-containing protein 52-like [Gekko japonicus]|uniref:Leucine-rich repeat-containing protein 52-like n=1 Tax=Gekko japonicus TaxID=146911 RepID=A0ABM1L2R7_GEKJA|nr:PREDICTED: leucine-rich repeat-containing protein 52-like [Gekko japonicus]
MKWAEKTFGCPTECTCDQWRVNCEGKNLSHVPSKIPLTTKELMLQKNNITSLPHIDLNYLSELVYLDCSQNQLKLDPHFSFTGPTKLIYLDLSVNRIAYVSHHTLSQLEKLMLLNLSSNPNLTLIEKEAFRGNPLLMYLDVSGCGLKHVDDDVFEHLSNLHILGINNNPWRCDCALLEFCTWIEETTIELTNTADILCKEPKAFQDHQLFGMVQHGLHFACLVHLETHDFLIMALIAFCIFFGGIFVAWLVGISTVMYYHPIMKADDESDEEECRMT